MTIYCNPGNWFFGCMAEKHGCTEEFVREAYAKYSVDDLDYKSEEYRRNLLAFWKALPPKIKDYCHKCSTS